MIRKAKKNIVSMKILIKAIELIKKGYTEEYDMVLIDFIINEL